MNIVIAKEPKEGEARIALTPQSAQKLSKLGATLTVSASYGASLGFKEQDYLKANVQFVSDIGAEIPKADLVALVNKPDEALLKSIKEDTVVLSFLEPFRSPRLIEALAKKHISSLCMELVPRTTYAQKMDALSSQASLAGYVAVIMAANKMRKSLPMMSTPAGTIPPARVFVIGAGVAGLQAIATAKRLGARVEAYDTRPVVEEQVQSLGAKFIKIDVGETGQTKQGYAKALTKEQIAKQQEQMANYIANADIVITTAQVFGRPAPRIVSRAMVEKMRPGSVVVDLAAATGGNVEGTVADQDVEIEGVHVIGMANFPGEVARDASQMYASNIANLIEHIWDKETNTLNLDVEDAIVNSVLLTHKGEIRDERIKTVVEEK